MTKKAVLVVDDELIIRKLASRILAGEGFTTLLAEDGRKAIDLYQAHMNDISLAILDLRMPDMSGIDVFRQLNRLNARVRVVLCSGYGTDDVPDDCADIFVQKPFSLEQFKDAVRRVLAKNDEDILEYSTSILQFKRKEESDEDEKPD